MAKDNDWGLTNGQGYILNRDRSHVAASRLNLQFYLWKAALQYNIHPSLTASLPSSPFIAEVASGTCLWAIEVAQSLPKAHIDALDYNLLQAPHQAWLPSNAATRHWDVFTEPPADLIGKFDLVHTRLLVLVVESQDPRPVLRNLFKLLKPGGRLQWDELDTVHASVRKVDSSLPTPALDELKAWSQADGRHDWTVNLPAFCTEVGFVESTVDFVSDPPELARAFNEQHLLTADEFAQGLVKLGKGEVAGKYFQIVEEAYGESVGGAALCVPRVVCTARRPLL